MYTKTRLLTCKDSNYVKIICNYVEITRRLDAVATTIATKRTGSANNLAHTYLRRFNIINDCLKLIVICTFDASKPLEAARKVHNYYYVHIITMLR